MPDSVWIKYAESLNCIFEKKILPPNFSRKSISREAAPFVSLIVRLILTCRKSS